MTGVAVGDAAGHVLPAPAADHPPLFRRVGPASNEQVDTCVAEVALLLARRLVRDAGTFRPPQRLRRFLRGLARRGRFVIGVERGVWRGSSAPRCVTPLATTSHFVPAALPFLAPGEWSLAHDAYFSREVFFFDALRHPRAAATACREYQRSTA